MDIHRTYKRNFLRKNDDVGDPGVIRSIYKRLMGLDISSGEDADKWITAWSEMNSAEHEVMTKAYFATTKDTRDEKAEKELTRLADEVVPLALKLDEDAKKRFVKLPEEWLPEDLSIMRERQKWAIEIYREENLPLITKDIKLEKDFNKITGAWITEFDGKKVTPQQLNPYLEMPDRDLRERAWMAKTGMHLADYDKLNELFDEMLSLRTKMAKNAGLSDFVAYQYKNYGRLSYTREDTEAFDRAILEYVVPVVSKIIERRMKKMGIEDFRPWDLRADPDGKKPPAIYEGIDDLKDKVADVMGAVDGDFAEAFRLMDERGYLDLENRPGKASGAYCSEFSEERIPLIFSNSVGTSKDFDTLIHEGGHAMHCFLTRHLSYFKRRVPTEFAEVASMSLELLTRPHWHLIYTDDDRERIGKKQLEETLIFLPFMAMLDEFQNWVYTSDDCADREKRADYWIELESKYRPFINYEGLEDRQKLGWQYNHVFVAPLYYIEYGIAQIGALQIYIRSLKEYDRAVADYKRALSLGTTVDLPELFKTAGVKFVMDEPDVLKEVVSGVMKEIGF